MQPKEKARTAPATTTTQKKTVRVLGFMSCAALESCTVFASVLNGRGTLRGVDLRHGYDVVLAIVLGASRTGRIEKIGPIDIFSATSDEGVIG